MSEKARIEDDLDGHHKVCLDCGAVVGRFDRDVHQRFHAILNAHARAIAVMVNQLPPDVRERATRGNDNNWSREAFEEVAAALSSEPQREERGDPHG